MKALSFFAFSMMALLFAVPTTAEAARCKARVDIGVRATPVSPRVVHVPCGTRTQATTGYPETYVRREVAYVERPQVRREVVYVERPQVVVVERPQPVLPLLFFSLFFGR